MALKQSAHARGVIPTPVATACEVVACRASFTLTGDLAVGDIVEMMSLPAGHVPVDILFDGEQPMPADGMAVSAYPMMQAAA